MSLNGGKLGPTTHISPPETGQAPSPEQAAKLLDSLRNTAESIHGPGTLISTDNLIGAAPATGIGAHATEGHQAPHTERTIAVDWATEPDGDEYHWEFPSESWKGRNGLLARLRSKLSALAKAD